MAVETSPNPRNTRKVAAAKAAPGKSDKSDRPDKSAKLDKTPRTATERTPRAALIDVERRRALIAESAYYRAERRGFAPGYEAEDWLAAELEIDRALAIGVSPSVNPAVQ
ncbi:MAG: DUF2934 domain-containing protein [Steroidobacteraceae bacterium]